MGAAWRIRVRMTSQPMASVCAGDFLPRRRTFPTELAVLLTSCDPGKRAAELPRLVSTRLYVRRARMG